MIYFWSVLYKLKDKFWKKGIIIKNIMWSPIWSKRWGLGFFSIPFVYKTLAYSSLLLEYTAWLAFIPELRIFMMFMLILFHLGITIFMRIGYFGPIMIIADLSFANQLFK
jgi:hypothetical protein